MQNDLWTALVESTQRFAGIGDMRTFYEALKAVCGPSHQIQAPLRSSDGSTLPAQRSCPSALVRAQHTVQESSLANIPRVDVKLELDDPPTCEEIKKATMQLKLGK